MPISKFAEEYKRRDLRKEYKLLYEITYSHKHQLRMNNDPAVYNLNRYTDIIPYDDTRVLLQDRWVNAENHAIDSYINADYINSVMWKNDKKLIATQGPLEITTGHFWRMVLQENVKLIICVCQLSENGDEKCHKYWPDNDSRKEKAF
jgi:protein tyrosine phosphatase